jgi:cyclase
MNKHSIAGLVGIAFALGASLAGAQPGPPPAKLEVKKVRDDIYVISNVAVPGLTTVLVTDEGVLLVDDKFEQDHDNIMAMLKTITNQPVKYVVNTHYHADHSGGNAKLQAMGTLAVASDKARARMVTVKQPGLQNITFSDHATINLGGKTVELYSVGFQAHTNGDIVVLFPQQRVLASGDIFANGPGTSAQLVDYAGGGSAKEWPKAVDAALKLDYDTVIPGHGLISTKKDLQDYRARAQGFSDTLSMLVKQGKSKADIEKIVRGQFAWEDFHVNMALDGLIAEFK